MLHHTKKSLYFWQVLLSKEWTTQGNPTSTGAYTLTIPLMFPFFLVVFFFLTKKVAFADHLTVAGKLADIKHLRDKLAMVSLKYYGHSLKTTKLYLIVKKII